jgi:isopentenyldiphosphate isomerase
MNDELLDIVDARGRPTGERRPRAEAHRLGLPHATVHVWIIDARGGLLLQKRAAGKETFPLYWDISAAGHITAGDTATIAAVRECAEELGLEVEPAELKLLFSVPQHFESADHAVKENEYCFVYLLDRDIKAADLQLQESEVDQVVLCPWREFQLRIKRGDQTIVPHGEEYQLLFKHLGKNGY